MGMGFAPTWLRQVSPPASHDHFNHCSPLKYMVTLVIILTTIPFRNFRTSLVLQMCRPIPLVFKRTLFN